MNPKMIDCFDKYMLGQMNEVEKQEFLNELNTNPELKKDFEEYQLLIQTFNQYHQKNTLEQKLNEWYTEEAVNVSKNTRKTWWVVSYVAASVALLVTFAGIGFYETLNKESKKHGNEISYLKKELKNIQFQQNTLVRNIRNFQEKKYAPANSQSTGFLFAPHYLLTTFHSVQNADSLFIENDEYPRMQAKVIYVNKDLDVAVLYVDRLTDLSSLYVCNGICDLGDKIFTLGFPTNQLVYNEGYISAINGYNNDTAFYQITMSLNPGNSGGPLFTNKGKLIGMIVSKNMNMEGVAFALKSNMLYTLKDSLPSDSLKSVWIKTFKPMPTRANKNISIHNIKPFIFKISVYQKST